MLKTFSAYGGLARQQRHDQLVYPYYDGKDAHIMSTVMYGRHYLITSSYKSCPILSNLRT